MDNKELQSRREFFKKSLCTVLPIIGSVVLANPLLSSCSKDDDEDDSGGGSSSGGGRCNGACTARAMLIGHQHHVTAVVKVLAFLAARHHV